MKRHIIFKDLEKEYIFDIPDDVKVLINWDNIPEISFLFLHNREEQYTNKLKELNDKIQILDKSSIKKVSFYLTKEQAISFEIPILNICYRTADYMAGSNFKNEEILSIKFCPEQSALVGYDNTGARRVCCDFKNCPFLEKEYCSKYKMKLEPFFNTYFVCKQCFCSMNNILLNRELEEEYERMRRNRFS